MAITKLHGLREDTHCSFRTKSLKEFISNYNDADEVLKNWIYNSIKINYTSVNSILIFNIILNILDIEC